MNQVGIVGYGMGNIGSLYNAFHAIGSNVRVVETPKELKEVSHVVLPGVGAFPKGMESLTARGFREELDLLVAEGKPLLGICLGMQLLASMGEEHSLSEGLGFIPGRVTKLETGGLRIPHIGWNDTVANRKSKLMGDPGTSDCFY
jgi:imidazole glycerol-phosphate synthase subunit HisH